MPLRPSSKHRSARRLPRGPAAEQSNSASPSLDADSTTCFDVAVHQPRGAVLGAGPPRHRRLELHWPRQWGAQRVELICPPRPWKVLSGTVAAALRGLGQEGLFRRIEAVGEGPGLEKDARACLCVGAPRGVLGPACCSGARASALWRPSPRARTVEVTPRSLPPFMMVGLNGLPTA